VVVSGAVETRLNLGSSSRRNVGFDSDFGDPNFKLRSFSLLDPDTGLTSHSGASSDFYLRSALDRRFSIGPLNDDEVDATNDRRVVQRTVLIGSLSLAPS